MRRIALGDAVPNRKLLSKFTSWNPDVVPRQTIGILALLFASFVMTGGVRFVSAQTPAEGTVVVVDPAMKELAAPGAKLEIIKENYFQGLEGPIWVPQGKSGYLLFSDIPANKIMKFQPGCDKFPCPIESGKLSVYLEHSGYTENEKVPHHERAGSNGLALDPQGRVVMDAYGEHGVVRLEKNGKRTVLTDTYDGKKYACPNDIVIKSDGAIYFTNGPSLCVLGKDPEGGLPNGITLSPDEKTLYVTASKKIMAYDVKPDDTVENGRVYIDFTAETQPGGPDGMRVDEKGNVWVTGPGGIWIISPQGKHLGTIVSPTGEGVRIANFAFGDPDRRTLYVVGSKNFWRIRLKVAGVKPRKS